VLRALSDRRAFYFSVSVTTRPRRQGEIDGVDYSFISFEEFEAMRAAGELLEWASYSGSLYGTPRELVFEHLARGTDVLLDIEVHGAMQVKAAVPDALTVFLMPPSIEELERRLRSRGDTEQDQAEARLDIARWQMQIAPREFDHLVVNEDVDEAVAHIERILDADLP